MNHFWPFKSDWNARKLYHDTRFSICNQHMRCFWKSMLVMCPTPLVSEVGQGGPARSRRDLFANPCSNKVSKGYLLIVLELWDWDCDSPNNVQDNCHKITSGNGLVNQYLYYSTRSTNGTFWVAWLTLAGTCGLFEVPWKTVFVRCVSWLIW